jgi:hypothetical protein
VTGRIAPTHVLIASYLEPEDVQRMRESAPQGEVPYQPSLLFSENLRRYLASRPLLNVFDRERGY